MRMDASRRHLLKLGLAAGALSILPAGPRQHVRAQSTGLGSAIQAARDFERLHGLIVAQEGRPLVEQAFRGPALERTVNVKSVAKTVIAALVGAAIQRGVLAGPEQSIVPLLGELVPDEADPRLEQVTIGHLLSMRAGLQRTSGQHYGRWVTSPNWVRHALTRPFEGEPGGEMRYSTGNSHLLSAILTRASGRSTLELARSWLGQPLDIAIPAWQQDPQGIYFGGNNMALSPRAMLQLGELYRLGGRLDGERVFAESWVETSWQRRGRSRWTGDRYGYGWFIRPMQGREVYYAWGYGGQMIYVCPELALTVVITSDVTRVSGASGYVRQLHGLVEREFLPALTS
ncbi:serine hydrolase domain-containing protein [Fodinicurvata halophila]|uniref:Serine hydrolase domain-containing protein n=1 Tax=Fodinicurvata halophila TaxID=1419723 RepID=A0ABV8UN15_9PROT